MMNIQETEKALQEILAKWAAFQSNPNQTTIAGCVAGMEKFAELHQHILDGGPLPRSWE